MNNNNRGNNNRRRGRGNNRQQGGQPVNRIDSRARGNAQQLLDKYRKLAHDSHLNGDRVQEEYYLQFADHYFRVLADQRVRQEETRQRRDGPQDGTERPRYEEPRSGSGYDYDYGDEQGGDEQPQPPAREARGEERGGGGYDADTNGNGGDNDSDSESRDGDPYEPAENPFVRDNRGARGPARSRGPRRESRNDLADEPRREEPAQRPEAGLEPSVLPPPIGVASDEFAEEPPAKPRRRTRKPRDTDGNDESLEAVG